MGQSYQLPEVVTNPPQNNQQKNAPLTYVLKFSDQEISEFQELALKPEQTVLDVLKELAGQNNLALATKDYQDLGVLVTKIGDKENGQADKYWQYWVNGVKPEVGSGSYKLTGGERVEWKFEEFKE